MSQPIVYLNGEYLPQDQAFVPVLDRGFVFGDGVYEVIPVYGSRLFRFDEHLLRLQNSLDGIRLANPMTSPQWQEMLQTLIEKNGGGEQSLYLQITRGVAPRDHAFPAETTPTVFATCSPLNPVADEYLQHGVKAITLQDFRWQNCHLKTIALLPNILLRQQAVDAGAMEAILIRDEQITEGAATNIFIVKDGVIKTPPKGPFLLPGITRDLVLELAASHHMAWAETRISPQELSEADEVWLSSSTKEVLAITQIDDCPVGNGQPGPVWRAMLQHYQVYKQALIAGEAH